MTQRSAGLTGIFCVIAVAVALFLPGASLPSAADSGQAVGAFINAHRAWMVGAWLTFPEMVFFLWFAVGLRDYLRRTGDRAENLNLLMVSGALATVAGGLIATTLQIVIGIVPLHDLGVRGMRALYVGWLASGVPVVFMPLTLMLFAAARSMHVHRSAPGWLVGTGYTAAAASVICPLGSSHERVADPKRTDRTLVRTIVRGLRIVIRHPLVAVPILANARRGFIHKDRAEVQRKPKTVKTAEPSPVRIRPVGMPISIVPAAAARVDPGTGIHIGMARVVVVVGMRIGIMRGAIIVRRPVNGAVGSGPRRRCVRRSRHGDRTSNWCSGMPSPEHRATAGSITRHLPLMSLCVYNHSRRRRHRERNS